MLCYSFNFSNLLNQSIFAIQCDIFIGEFGLVILGSWPGIKFPCENVKKEKKIELLV